MKTNTPLSLLSVLLLIAIFCFASCDHPIPPPESSISFETATELENEFQNSRSVILDSALGFQDTRDFWFSLETLKDYIEYVEYNADKMGKENLGIRVYFSAYPEQGDYPQPGFSTVIMVPTAEEEGRIVQKGFLPMAPINQNIDSLNVLNFGHGGQPPNDL